MKKDKLIVSNRSALVKKYGSKHKTFLKDLTAIKDFDKKRKMSTVIVFLDDATAMKKYKVPAVKNPEDQRQNKAAIDALYKYFQPDYLLIAGAQDVIPFQELENLLSGDDDEDELIPSDLPYACEAPYHTDPGKFIAPTRVVGRLPDVPGSNDPAYFHSLVKDVLTSKPVKDKEYRKYFSVSVFEWRLSTQESLHNIFGENGLMQISPVSGPKWTATQLKAKTHFINCHGSLEDHCYYGQKGANYPEAVNASMLAKMITKGTIAAAECCYGAQLYNPKETETSQMSVANTYLINHAIAFMGSSTIAYGPTEGQGLADILTQDFLINTIKGASTGRALLEARQSFLDKMGPTLDPYELKTIAQFYLLGEPSVVPVASAPVSKAMNFRKNNRDNMISKGAALSNFIATPTLVSTKKEGTAFAANVRSLLKDKKFSEKATKKVFETAPKPNALTRDIKAFNTPVKFHVYSSSSTSGRHKKTKVLVVKEKNGEILGYREYVRR
ncbi:hypothetical protein GFS24_25600 [Chitinophaga sp. SYP-B3965]|uniref:hypothetical protein n=1 Tax=Chitinophaga sp. SYP-B3965 TaxID=2663120 RepID=UPI001299C7E5|nr:hypothetical protein [Chitinophaga sp. SYP-B3965]MRG48517.1 hypothetical protein [Chitinophaga sp. SYP-B3965]